MAEQVRTKENRREQERAGEIGREQGRVESRGE